MYVEESTPQKVIKYVLSIIHEHVFRSVVDYNKPGLTRASSMVIGEMYNTNLWSDLSKKKKHKHFIQST